MEVLIRILRRWDPDNLSVPFFESDPDSKTPDSEAWDRLQSIHRNEIPSPMMKGTAPIF